MISAIIPAAGESKRMGEQKMLMKWGEETVLGHIISVYAMAGVEDILVITGWQKEEIKRLVEDLVSRHPVRHVFNAEHSSGGMLSSIQRGLQDVAGRNVGAALIALGDQPQVEEGSVRLILDEYRQTAHPLIVPSYQQRRGHPWLVGRQYWEEILRMNPPQTLRDFLNRHASEIRYVDVRSSSVLTDLDTPSDYEKSQPR